MSILTDQVALADALTAAGLKGVHDPAKVNPPCVVVEPPAVDLSEATLSGEYLVEWRIVIVGEGTGDAASTAQLFGMLPTVLGVVDVDWTPVRAAPGMYRPSPTADARPALIITAEGVTTL